MTGVAGVGCIRVISMVTRVTILRYILMRARERPDGIMVESGGRPSRL